ncbi:MAG TPA: hypothetical protein VM737_09705 [Gemmatimonadota bacterium]|nr:hypothetical protein [Gemmatimonadota bacterium]
MSGAAWITLVLVCGYVWGGALLLVTIAMRRERAKEGERTGPRER